LFTNASNHQYETFDWKESYHTEDTGIREERQGKSILLPMAAALRTAIERTIVWGYVEKRELAYKNVRVLCAIDFLP